MRHFRFFIFFLLMSGMIGMVIHPRPVSAHAGGGPPFLLVNGKYAQTNPFYAGGSEVQVSQDVTYDKYLPNTPINFEIDIAKLQIPADIIASSTFRWRYSDDAPEYEYGTKVSHHYPKTGSYVLTLEVKAASEPMFLVLDTVQIDVVPALDYQLPSATIGVFDTSYKSGRPLHFQAMINHDPSTNIASATWVFGTIKQTGTDTTHTYTDQDFFEIAFLKVFDANGLSTDAAISVQGDKGLIALASLSPKDPNVPVVGTTKQSPRLFVIGGIVGIGILSGIVWLFKRSRRKKRLAIV